METWAGAFHSACCHGACFRCLAKWVDTHVPACCNEQILRIPCIEPGCRKFMPQPVVFHVSELARAFSRGLDRVWENNPLLNNDCMELCQVCCSYIGPLLVHGGQAACEGCVGKWVDGQLLKCRQLRRVECMAFNLQDVLPEEVVLLTSKQARILSRAQRNPLYPPAVQVDCPQFGCCGIGYLGAETIMCFVCEHQWDAPLAACEEYADDMQAETLKIKMCPQCNVAIEKNGGCDHMTCRCGHEFWWSTLLPYRSRR